MAGGIFPNYPFELNIKCVIFSGIIIGLFFYCPPEMNIYWKSFVSFLLFVIAYVALAWYDYKFDCQKMALKKGTSPYGITGQLKPPPHTESQIDSSKMKEDERAFEGTLIHLYHLLFVTPLCIYIGLNGDKALGLSIILMIANFSFAILYHLFRVLRKFNGVSAGHVAFSIVSIIYLILSKRPQWFYYMMIGLGGYAGFKHGYNLMIESHHHDE
jgi:hypothetical protein